MLGAVGLLGAAATWRLLLPARKRAVSPRPASRLAPVLANLRNPRLLATFGIGFCMLFALVAVFSYVTFHLAAAPFYLSTAALSWLFSVYLFGLLATLAVGTVLARVGLRRGMLGAVGLCLAGVGLTLGHSLVAVGVGLALASSGVFIAQTCANSFLRDAAPAGSRVSAAGMYISSYYIGGTVGGILPGLLWARVGWPGCIALTGRPAVRGCVRGVLRLAPAHHCGRSGAALIPDQKRVPCCCAVRRVASVVRCEFFSINGRRGGQRSTVRGAACRFAGPGAGCRCARRCNVPLDGAACRGARDFK